MNRRNTILKYLALGSAAFLLVGLTVWLVRMEGERTRDAMREAAGEAGRAAGAEVREGIVEGAERTVGKAAEVPGKVLRDVKGELPSGPVEQAGESVGQAVKSAGDLARTARDTLTGRPAKRDDEPVGQKAAASDDPVQRLFDLGRDVVKAVDDVGQEVFALSWEEEEKAGREVHRALAREYRLLRTPEVVQRVDRLARPIARQRTREELAFTFHVIASKEVNAFAHAGGYVYVTTAMLDLFRSDAELQFFLAHEIAHHELKHTVQRITYAARVGEVGGDVGRTLAQAAYLAIALGYSQEQELEADAWAFRAMLATGRSRDEALAAMRRMLTHGPEQQREAKPAGAQTVAQKTLRQIENHFRSHPPTAERLKALEALAVPVRGGR